jgi:polyketide synthase PksJ/polyketide synthase PksN
MKPNIGHPLCAEGIASLIKSVLMLQRRQRVPFLSAREPMAHFDLDASPFRFSRTLSAMGDAPGVVAVNCFADGGTNAHVILEAWQETEPRATRAALAMPQLRRVDCRSHSNPIADLRSAAENASAADFWEQFAMSAPAPAAAGRDGVTQQ